MRKTRPDSPLAALPPDQADQLYSLCQRLPYGRALAEAEQLFGLQSSVSSLARWWKRESKRRLREKVRRGITASKAWDTKVDEAALDTRMAKALKEGFFQLLAEGAQDDALDFANLALQANKDKRNTQKLQRLLAAESRADKAELALAECQAKIAELQAALSNAGQPAAVDTRAIMSEVDKLLGRA